MMTTKSKKWPNIWADTVSKNIGFQTSTWKSAQHHECKAKENKKKTVRYCYVSITVSKFETLTISSAGEIVKKIELSRTAGTDPKWYNHSGKQFVRVTC